MKPTYLLLVALAITPPLMAAQRPHKKAAKPQNEATSQTAPTTFSVTGADGSVKNYSIDVPAAPPPPATPSTGNISQTEAVLAALGWAPGFYGATGTAASSVDQVPTPSPYYLVHLTGKVGDSVQPLYAAVLYDGRIVRPTVTEAPMKEVRPAGKSKSKKKSG
jgi:hypothetical protein